MLDSILHPVDPGRVETSSSRSADALHFVLVAMFGNVGCHVPHPNSVANTPVPQKLSGLPDGSKEMHALDFNSYKNPKFGTTSFSSPGFPSVAFLVPNQPVFSGSAGLASPSFFCCSNVARYSLFNFRPVV